MTKYLLAISGGIDSATLLDLIATNSRGFRTSNFASACWPVDFMVAHFDHGIRGKYSQRDAVFAGKLAKKYNVDFIVGHGQLASNASEELAREKRYSFFKKIALDIENKYGDPVILVVAHHQDDLIESAVINLIRGTGWRGLTPMQQAKVSRPLIHWTKEQIVTYAIQHELDWVEDSTNDSMRYLRNRVRCLLATWPESKKLAMVSLINDQEKLRRQIEAEVAEYIKRWVKLSDNCQLLSRYQLIMLPECAALEVLRNLTDCQLTTPQLRELLLFVKTAKPNKKMAWKNIYAQVDKRQLKLECYQEKPVVLC